MIKWRKDTRCSKSSKSSNINFRLNLLFARLFRGVRVFVIGFTFMSTNYNEQNGRQAPLPTLGFDTHMDKRMAIEQQAVCRKFVWGTCNKGSTCKFKHELIFNEMKKILMFCHDYQNKQGCTRVDCSYLHTSSEEENLFLTNGRIPSVLQERYIALQPETSNCMSPSFEVMPPLYVTPPPPPPPPPPTSGLTVAPPPPPPPPPPIQPTLPPIQQPPPPPLPTKPSTAVVQTPPMFSMPPPPITVPPVIVPAIPVYDASRPPPSYGTQNQSRKRQADQVEAGTSKARKEENQDENCEICVERENRIDVYKQQLEKLQCEEECQRLLYKMKLDEYENGKRLLRSIIVNPDIYRKLEEYIEGGPTHAERQYQEIFSGPSTSTVPRNFLLSLLELILENRRNEGENLSPRLDETIMQALSIPRRTARHSPPSDVQVVLDLLRNANTPIERPQLTDPTPRLEPEPTPTTNGFSRYNGQKLDNTSTTSSTPNRYPNSGRSSRSSSSPVAGPSGLSSNSSQASHSPAPSFPVYHPAIPPPLNRPFFGPRYGPSTSAPPPPLHTSNNRLPAPPTPQMPLTRPSTSAVPGMPPNGQNFKPYTMGRYPHRPNYYPPYQ